MRPLTNLRQQVQFKLDKKEMRSGFVGIFDPKLGSRNVLNQVYYCLVADAICPTVRNIAPDADLVKKIMSPSEGVPSPLRDKDRKRVVHSVLKKNNAAKRLEFRTTLGIVSDKYMTSSLDMAGVFQGPLNIQDHDYQLSGDYATNPSIGGGKIITGKEVASWKNIHPKARAMFETCLEKIEATQSNGQVWIWATWIISQKEAEYLCNCKWMELRMSDIYPTLIDWVASIFGRYTRLPKTISKVSMIAHEVKETLAAAKGTVKPRVGVDGIVADINGGFYVIPEVDQSAQYEQMLMDFGLKPDGTYSWAQIKSLGGLGAGDASPVGGEDDDEGNGEGNDDLQEDNGDEETLQIDLNETKQSGGKKLPANMPIFSDWLNDKFVYSNTAGNLAVYDLSDTMPAKEFHFSEWLSTTITGNEQRGSGSAAIMAQMVNVAGQLDGTVWDAPKADDFAGSEMAMSILSLPKNQEQPRSFAGAMDMAFRLQTQVYEGDEDKMPYAERGTKFYYVKIEDLQPESQFDGFKFVGRILLKAAKAIEENMEVLYNRMSVMSALQLLAYSRMIKHAPHAHVIREQDMAKRGKYINQAVDPNYKLKPIPNIHDKIVLRPHQYKVQNLMREHPENAAYPVDAGGGKTILILLNILEEMRDGKIKKPIIACPSTLVDQYVQEAVDQTHGRVNIIPVTNQTARMHGLERLQKMIETAPPNTIVVTDFDFVKGKNKNVAYGNKSVVVWNNAEWLRQFEFDLIAIDEVHKLKNLASARRQAVARLMQDIPYKRIASGTLVDDTLVDLVSQVALFDPTIFGSQEKFKSTYAASERGGKVLAWRQGAQKEIQQRISEHCIWAQAKRKEWAALLPTPVEQFWAVNLTENQRLLYDSILKETTDLIEEAMAKNPELKEALESGDETLADDLESMLRPYLSRLERFLSAPEVDEAASIFLKSPEDLVSPKVRKVHEICREHIERKIPGKIVIFTNYTASAKAVYDHAPPDLKKLMIHYTAGRKMECRAQFAKDDRKLIMVGQSSSMDTGINFQVASRLIRMETIWTPGTLEQGNARINRPQLKSKEARTHVYFDWLAVNRSIDITKIARLTAKIISKAKFDNAKEGTYDKVADMKVIPMRISTIASKNDFATDLKDYLLAYQDMQRLRDKDYADYIRDNPDKIDPVAQPQGGMLKGSKLMSRVPYVPGMTIYGTEQLGLVRYDEFCNIDLDELELEDNEVDEGGKDDEEKVAEDDPKKAEKLRHIAQLKLRWAAELELAMNMPCHTEFGDGVIYGARRKVWVRLRTGEVLRVPKLQTFVITRTTTNAKDMRKELLKAVGDVPLTEPIEVPVEVGGETNKRRKKIEDQEIKKGKRGGKIIEEEPEVDEEEAKPQASFQFTVINDMLAIMLDVENSSDGVAEAMQNYGFKISPEYWFCRLKGPKMMLKLFNTLAAKGFTIDKKTSDHLRSIWAYMEKHGRQMIGQVGFASTLDITHFHREVIKPSSDPKHLKIYPMVQDGVLYMVAPSKGQTGNNKAVHVQVPQIQWKRGGGADEFLRFCHNKNEAKDVLAKIKEDGFEILNSDELGKQWKALKIGPRVKS
jgi:hypothetical protein